MPQPHFKTVVHPVAIISMWVPHISPLTVSAPPPLAQRAICGHRRDDQRVIIKGLPDLEVFV